MNSTFLTLLTYLAFTLFGFGATLPSDFINSDGTITPTIIEILGQTGVRIAGFPVNEEWPDEVARLDSLSCEDVTALIQGRNLLYPNYSWLRKSGTERWESVYTLPEINSLKIINLVMEDTYDSIKGLNMRASYEPVSKTFDGILYLGSTLGSFEERVKSTGVLIDSGKISVDPSSTILYILTGRRKFNEKEREYLLREGNLELLEINNEREGMTWVFEKHKHPLLESMTLEIVDDDAPSASRATTKSTAECFFRKVKPEDGRRYLIVSSHMFAVLQYLTIQRTAYIEGCREVHFEICSHPLERLDLSNLQSTLSQVLDNLARVFYEICAYKKLTGEYPLLVGGHSLGKR